MNKRAFTINEFSAAYGLNPATVQTNVSRNPESLPKVVRIGRSVRFLLTDIEKWEVKLTE
ncbi:MAG: hypothetical protein RPS47_06110 [Colwellia sp.]|jgi:hypothetical protein